MAREKKIEKRMTAKEKLTIAGVAGLFAASGAVLGMIVYWQHWLG